jgi:two-component system NtrC family response regulator
MANVLIVDDDRFIRDALTIQLRKMQHMSIEAETLGEGLDLMLETPIDIVLLDVHLPDGDGLKVLTSFRKSPSHPEVIIITGEASAKSAELAINSGAWDYIQKPFSKHELELQITRALEYRCSKMESRKKSLVTLKRTEIIGDSPELSARLDLAAQCAGSNANVLITGETGTGKESFAKVIHQNSPSAENDFIVVDCAALPEHLVESTLFGHTKGAFTGADMDRTGLVQQAHGGTLFLDEVGELPLSLQKKFLRVLQERRFKPVGSTREIVSNFRLIAATHRNLDEMVAKGRFREDLLYRMRTFYIDLPPLRSCVSDIRNLTLHYIDRLCGIQGLENKGFSPEFIECLEAYHWPGNVRELINTLEKAILADRDAPKLFPIQLPRRIRLKSIQSSLNHKNGNALNTASDTNMKDMDGITFSLGAIDSFPPLKQLREKIIGQVEQAYLSKLMPRADYDLMKVSQVSGLSKPRLYALLQKYCIARKGSRR